MDLEGLARHIAESLPLPLRREAMSYLDGGIPRAWLRERIDLDSPLIT